MILEKGKYKRNGVYIVIRICDECGKNEDACLSSVIRGRKTRGKNIDLCRKCSYLKKYTNRKTIKGKKHHSWKHGLQDGYRRITLKDGRRIREHRYIYEQYLGRKIKQKELIHHIDFDKLNNNIDNLILFKNNGEHRKCHMGSMEECSLFFLNSKIWFNFKKYEYTLKYEEEFCERNEIEIDLSIFDKKIGDKSPIYKVKRVDGTIQRRKCYLVISEYFLNRRLYNNEVVHHIDGNSLNDDPNNLIVLTRKSHINSHYSLQKCTTELLKNGFIGFNREKKEYYVKYLK